ncbi:MAG: trypsin-like serine protease [Devosia sp.]
MNLKTFAAVTALLAGALALSSPVLAQSSPPGKPSGNPPEVSRDAPVSLGKPTPIALPKVDPETLNRDLGDVTTADNYGTVSISKDGTVTEEAASDSLRAILEADSPGERGNGAAQLTSGTDDRKQITDSKDYPFSAVGWLVMQNQKDGWGSCSAALIGPALVITAAHCVYDHWNGGWQKEVYFIPGALSDDFDNAPYGIYSWTDMHVVQGYISNFDGENYGSAMPWDLATIELSVPVGNDVGWLGYKVDAKGNWDANILGYPADKTSGTMWYSACKVTDDNYKGLSPAETGNTFWHTCDTFSGSSGSSIWEVADDAPYVRGINVAEDIGETAQYNYATMLNEANFAWVNQYNAQ